MGSITITNVAVGRVAVAGVLRGAQFPCGWELYYDSTDCIAAGSLVVARCFLGASVVGGSGLSMRTNVSLAGEGV